MSPSTALQLFARASAVGVTLMGALVMLGWIFSVAALQQVIPGLVSMKPNTAACFMAAGLSLLLLQRRLPEQRISWSRVLALLILALSGLSLMEYLLRVDLHIDQLLFRDHGRGLQGPYPGRMAPTTAVNLIFVSLALICSRPPPARGTLTRWLSVPSVVIAMMALLGYAYGVTSLYALGSYSGMALHTATGFLFLGLAIIASHPNDGFLVVLASDSPGGLGARRLLPVTTVLLFVLGLLWLGGARQGLYDLRFGFALLAFSSILLTILVVAWHSSLLHRADAVRRDAESRILALNESLEQRVVERTSKLQEALTEVRQLGSLLPICAWCNRIRDDRDYWHSVEGYISKHSDTRFTHAMCPECAATALSDVPDSLHIPQEL